MHLIRLFQIWKPTTQTVSHENVSQSSTCHAFRWLIPFYINAAFHLLHHWGTIWIYRHCLFSDTRIYCTYVHINVRAHKKKSNDEHCSSVNEINASPTLLPFQLLHLIF